MPAATDPPGRGDGERGRIHLAIAARLRHGGGRAGSHASGGQRQRIAIARAIIRDTPILVLDEPSSGLDAASEELVFEAIDRLIEGRTTIVIAHRFSTIRRANTILVVENGRIVENGKHDHLLAAGGCTPGSTSFSFVAGTRVWIRTRGEPPHSDRGPARTNLNPFSRGTRHYLRYVLSLPGLVAVVVLGIPSLGVSAEAPGISNFRKVDEQVYRGAQPTDEGLRYLAKAGIKVILDLREHDERSLAEERVVTAAGMRYINVPMTGMTPPTEAETGRILALLENPATGPVFVHCKRGADRTGAVIAAYRIDHDKWENARALEEAKADGMGTFQFQRRRFIRTFQARTRDAGGHAADNANGDASDHEAAPPVGSRN